MAPDLKIIEDGFERLVSEIPDLAASAASALSAVKASWERAALPEKRLSNAARHSIAIYVMGVVAAAYGRGARSDEALKAMGRLIKHSTSIDAKPSDRHVKAGTLTPGGRWEGPEGGPWTSETASGWKLTLVHSPHMPGGNWAVSVGAVPCLYGDDPSDVEARTIDLLSSVDETRRRGMLNAQERASVSVRR